MSKLVDLLLSSANDEAEDDNIPQDWLFNYDMLRSEYPDHVLPQGKFENFRQFVTCYIGLLVHERVKLNAAKNERDHLKLSLNQQPKVDSLVDELQQLRETTAALQRENDLLKRHLTTSKEQTRAVGDKMNEMYMEIMAKLGKKRDWTAEEVIDLTRDFLNEWTLFY